jgi:hypothetical protein
MGGADLEGVSDNAIVDVVRDEGEVFDAGAVASFEGKPFTNEHPPELLTPENSWAYVRGVVHNVRRGTGENEDCLLADIIVYDQGVIEAVEGGKREVSCGYVCNWEREGDKKYRQTWIRGNHVALVDKGRAGEEIAIKDHAIGTEERSKKVSKKNIFGHMLKAFARDASPEELLAATDTIQEVISGEEGVKGNVTPPATTGTSLDDAPPAPAGGQQAPPQQQAGGNDLAEIKAMLTQLIQALQPAQQQQQAPPQPQNAMDALDALEEELLEKSEESEGSAVIEPTKDGGELTEPAAAPKATDSGALVRVLRAVKPAIAQMKDPQERKATTDTLATLIRQARVQGQMAGTSGGYAAIMQAAAQNARKQVVAMDAAPEDEYALGRKWAEMYNPHYKKAKEGN